MLKAMPGHPVYSSKFALELPLRCHLLLAVCLSGSLLACGASDPKPGAASSSDDGDSGIDEPVSIDSDGDGTPDSNDCAPDDAAVHPGADEVCNEIDDNCDGVVDDDAVDRVDGYVDADGDGFGDAEQSATFCPSEPGWTADATDCDDTDPAAFPGAADESPDACMRDVDGDGHGDSAAALPVVAGSDCDDDDASTHPGSAELEPDLCARDVDDDGYGDWNAVAPVDVGTDCNDGDPDTYPNAPEEDATILEDPACDGTDRSLADAELVMLESTAFVENVTGGRDIDGDGVSDLMVGSPTDQPQRVAARILSGAAVAASTGTPPIEDLSWLDFHMAESNHDAGRAVALLNDRDGDGLAEAFVGIPGWEWGGTAVVHHASSLAAAIAEPDWDGELELRQGAMEPEGDLVFHVEVTDVEIDGDGSIRRYLGSELAEGDLDGDGLSDIILVAPDSREGSYPTLVYLGATLAAPHALPWRLLEADFILQSTESGTGLYRNQQITIAPDIDGDGLGELVVGTSQHLYLFTGASLTARTEQLLDLDEADLQLDRMDVLSIDASGDLDGDGRSDLLVALDAGGAMVWTGATLAAFLEAEPQARGPESADLVFQQDEGRAYFGGEVSFAGDLDGDGLDDVMVLGFVNTPARPDQLWLARGRTLRGRTGTILVDEEGHRILQQPSEAGIVQAAPVGDLNGDGRDDVGVVLTASGYNGVMIMFSRL